MNGREVRELMPSNNVKEVTLQLTVTIDDNFTADDAAKTLAVALGEPVLERREAFRAGPLGRADLRLRKKLENLDYMEALFEYMAPVEVIKVTSRERRADEWDES